MNLYDFKIYLALLILAHASLSDWKYREIKEETWLSMLVLGFLFFLYEGAPATTFLSSLIFSALFALVLYRLRFMEAGDAKIIIGIGAMFYSNQNAALTLFPFPSISAFANAVFLSSFLPVLFFVYNVSQLRKPEQRNGWKLVGWRDFLVLFLGYRKNASLVSEHEAVMGKDGRYKFLNLKSELGKKHGNGTVWVTPALPFVIPFTVGFLLSVYFGDVPSYLLLWLQR